MLLQLEHDSEYIVAELEMILDKMMFADAKKKYAGRKKWTDKHGWLDDDVPFAERQKIMGYEYRRGNSPFLSRSRKNKVLYVSSTRTRRNKKSMRTTLRSLTMPVTVA